MDVLRVCVFCVLLLQLMVTSTISEVLIRRDVPIYYGMTHLRSFSDYWNVITPPPTKVRVNVPQDLLSERLLKLICFAILYCFMRMLYVRIIPAHGRCVVVIIARNRGSTTTTNVFCRTIDDSGSGERRDFQLLKSENRSFWTNEEVTNEGIKIGCILEYRVRTCWHSLLGGRDEKQFIFHRNASIEPRHQPGLNTSQLIPARGHCVVVARARNCGSTTNIYCRNIDNNGSGVGKPFQLQRSENKSFWTNKEVENEGIKVGCVLEYRVLTCYQSSLGRYFKLGKQDGKQFIFHRNDRNLPLGINELLKDLQDKNVFRRREQLCGYVNLKANRFQGLLEKLYTKLHMARTRIYFIGIRAYTIKNERVTLKTMDNKFLDMPLNCRESLVLSTAPVHMPLERPRKVADDDGDDSVDSDDSDDHGVPGVAVVKIEACELTCEGIISRYKPWILSINEEPVDIMNASGSWILVQGRKSFCFDTCNTAAACISIELLQKLGLEVNLEDTVPVHLAGAKAEFPEVKVELKIRQHHFEGLALVGAVPEGWQLLVGMEIFKKLRKLGYTLG